MKVFTYNDPIDKQVELVINTNAINWRCYINSYNGKFIKNYVDYLFFLL